MSLDTYRSLDARGDPSASSYLSMHFDRLFAEAIDEFTFYGQLAVGLAAVVVSGVVWSWFRLRNRLPWRWLWLLPLGGLTAYAALKSAVVLELIRLAPDLPQMWSLYFKSTTPFRMVRTSVGGLIALTIIMWAVAFGLPRLRQRDPPPDQPL